MSRFVQGVQSFIQRFAPGLVAAVLALSVSSLVAIAGALGLEPYVPRLAHPGRAQVVDVYELASICVAVGTVSCGTTLLTWLLLRRERRLAVGESRMTSAVWGALCGMYWGVQAGIYPFYKGLPLWIGRVVDVFHLGEHAGGLMGAVVSPAWYFFGGPLVLGVVVGIGASLLGRVREP